MCGEIEEVSEKDMQPTRVRETTSDFASFTIHLGADDICSDDPRSYDVSGTATVIDKKKLLR